MKFIVFIVLLFTSFSVAACGSSSTHSGSLIGTWASDDSSMIAHISSTTIVIDHVQDDGSALYWKGTVPSSASEGMKFMSIGDTEAMEYALLASSDDTKQFTYKDGKLLFKFSILGITKIIRLSR